MCDCGDVCWHQIGATLAANTIRIVENRMPVECSIVLTLLVRRKCALIRHSILVFDYERKQNC